MLVLWAYSRTHFPTFGYLDRQFCYLMMVFRVSHRVVDLAYRRVLLFLVDVLGIDRERLTWSIHIFGYPLCLCIHIHYQFVANTCGLCIFRDMDFIVYFDLQGCMSSHFWDQDSFVGRLDCTVGFLARFRIRWHIHLAQVAYFISRCF